MPGSSNVPVLFRRFPRKELVFRGISWRRAPTRRRAHSARTPRPRVGPPSLDVSFCRTPCLVFDCDPSACRVLCDTRRRIGRFRPDMTTRAGNQARAARSHRRGATAAGRRRCLSAEPRPVRPRRVPAARGRPEVAPPSWAPVGCRRHARILRPLLFRAPQPIWGATSLADAHGHSPRSGDWYWEHALTGPRSAGPARQDDWAITSGGRQTALKARVGQKRGRIALG